MLSLPLAGADAAPPPQYRITHEVALPGDEGWDYLTFDAASHRLFIAHATRVQVIDTERLSLVGEIADTPGVHGIALAPELNRGYISAGRAGLVVVFDLKSLARLQQIRTTGENPDAILYERTTQRVFTFNGRGRNATVLDANSGELLGTLALDAKPEFAVSDGEGQVYVNLEDRNSIARIDARSLRVSAVWPLQGCDEPTGLAIDAPNRRLFAVCGNQVMAVVDASSGHVLGTAPIGAGVDAAAYDAEARLAFASCGSGVLTALSLSPAGLPAVAQSLATRPGARTMALDARRHRIFLVTADFGATPAPTLAEPRPRPPIAPGSFRLLVVEAQARRP
jgi:hypothetical protein